MSYASWFESHARKHKKIVDKLVTRGYQKERIVKYFDFENMVKKENDFCPLYEKNEKCHNLESLNCYLCACPNFRFKDSGVKKMGDAVQYSFCDVDSKEGRQGVYANKIHQDCSKCSIPHAQTYVKKNFDLDWKTIMSPCET